MRERTEASAAARADEALDPAARLKEPAWDAALRANGIEPAVISAVVDGDGGSINTPGSSSIGMPNMRHVSVGTVVLTTEILAYAFRSGKGVDVIVRRRTEIDEMRKSNMGGSVWVVFEGDRSFPDRGDQIGRADNWELRAPDHHPDAVRSIFVTAGYDV